MRKIELERRVWVSYLHLTQARTFKVGKHSKSQSITEFFEVTIFHLNKCKYVKIQV